MTDIVERADAAKRLLANTTFQDVIDELRQEAVRIFLNPGATPEQITEAHLRVRELDRISSTLGDWSAMAKKKGSP